METRRKSTTIIHTSLSITTAVIGDINATMNEITRKIFCVPKNEVPLKDGMIYDSQTEPGAEKIHVGSHITTETTVTRLYRALSIYLAPAVDTALAPVVEFQQAKEDLLTYNRRRGGGDAVVEREES